MYKSSIIFVSAAKAEAVLDKKTVMDVGRGK